MTTSPDPLVTVYIATRDRAPQLRRALESVWAQERDDIEVFVVDDASQDDTAALLTDLGGRGMLRWWRNERNLGACASRNIALRNARGRFVTGLDDDDEMLPGRLDALLAALRATDAFVCATDCLVDGAGRSHLRICPPVIDAHAILSRNFVGNQVLAERRKMLACGGFDESLEAAQDYDMWIRMILAHGAARGLPQPLQRVHTGGMDRISVSPRRQRAYLRVYRRHKPQMDDTARAIHLYNLHRVTGRRLGAGNAARFFVAGNRMRVASRIVSERVPMLGSLLGRLAAWIVAKRVRQAPGS